MTKTATKTKGSTVEFYVQVPVTAKDIRDVIEASLADITEGFAYGDSAVRKRVDETRKALFTDGKFRTKLADYLTKEGKAWLQAELTYGDARFDSFPTITKLRKAIESIEDEQFEKYQQDREQQKIKDAIKMLKEQGYTVTQR